MTLTNAERQARWRKNHPAVARARSQKLRDTRAHAKRFIGLDGEGAGTDEHGRQNYLLLRAGDGSNRLRRKLHTGERLRTEDCLDFILALPKEAILVGYFFGYDTTMILRDLPPDRLKRLFEPHDYSKGKAPYTRSYTRWESFGIEYLPRQYLRVCRIDRNTLKVIPGSARTVNEVGGFFQKSFVEALRDWEIGDKKTIEMIAANKDRRESFTEISEEEARYCAAECKLLAQLMQKFRATCIEANLEPRQWRGAGHIAARLHELHDTPKRKSRKRSKIIDSLASAAYYGGRFEVTTIGRITGEIWEYDINSAYPAGMLELPCPMHSRWKKFQGNPVIDAHRLYIADLSFSHDDSSFLGSFPIRERGRLYFPRMGSGVYWSPEILAAIRAGATVRVKGGYYCDEKCSCRPFEWVRELYEFRKSIGKSARGYPIKLGINGLYGKFAQRIGSAPWQDYVMAGLITSFTRAKLIDAYSNAPDDVLYIATDAIYSRRRLPLDIGSGLGQWEESRRDGMFVVQPGIYWSGDKQPKTRGIPRSIIIENREAFESAWDTWLETGAADDPPIVPLFVNQFIGLRAALARNKPEIAGSWYSDLCRINPQVGMRNIDFDWQRKRRPYGDYIRGEAMVTQPFPGAPSLRSQDYDGNVLTDLAEYQISTDGDPDYVPWGNSGE
jgi:DNA polymerase family B